MAGQTVLVDAQFGIAKILRPYAGFEADYQGKDPLHNPIALTERGIALDPLAGKPGYAPNLVRGLPVSMGARIVLWLPNVIASIVAGPLLSAIPYRYAVAWRLRSTFDYRQIRGPYHYPKQGKGVPDTTAPPGKQDRVVKAAGWQTVGYTQPEPIGSNGGALPGLIDDRAAVNLHAEDIVNRCGSMFSPLIPGGGIGAVQQGILDPGAPQFIPFANAPFYNVHEVQAEGDEMLLFAYRDTEDPRGTFYPIWDFTPSAVDENFSIYYGNGSGKAFPDIGVYVFGGVAA